MKKFSYREISDQELQSLTDVIATKFGLDFSNYEKKSLKRGISRLMFKNGFESVLDLWKSLMSARELLPGYIDEMTVNLTELFRNKELWIGLNELIQKNYRGKDKQDLAIWHSGCSTGEEVYSMAILLQENGLWERTWSYATDLNPFAIKSAVKGTFPLVLKSKYLKAFDQCLPDAEFERYFEISMEQNHFGIKKDFTKNIDFQCHNLISDPYKQNSFDLIFCRNVLIYFDDMLKIQILQKLHKSIRKGGFLVIGFYDFMPNDCKHLFEPYDSSARIYKKVDSDDPTHKNEALTARERLKKRLEENYKRM